MKTLLAAERVVYRNPVLHPCFLREGLSLRQIIEGALKRIEAGEEAYSIRGI